MKLLYLTVKLNWNHKCVTLQHTTTHYNTQQHTAIHSNILQHTSTRCNTVQQHTTLHNNRKIVPIRMAIMDNGVQKKKTSASRSAACTCSYCARGYTAPNEPAARESKRNGCTLWSVCQKTYVVARKLFVRKETHLFTPQEFV